jgi:calcineurin-like phosphoesterase family protein
VHGNLDGQPHGLSLDVGVDSQEFRPLSLAQVAKKLEHRTSPFKRARD